MKIQTNTLYYFIEKKDKTGRAIWHKDEGGWTYNAWEAWMDSCKQVAENRVKYLSGLEECFVSEHIFPEDPYGC